MLVGDVFYYSATGRLMSMMDHDVSASYGRKATSPTDAYYSVWSCSNGNKRHEIVTFKGEVVFDGESCWTAPWEKAS